MLHTQSIVNTTHCRVVGQSSVLYSGHILHTALPSLIYIQDESKELTDVIDIQDESKELMDVIDIQDESKELMDVIDIQDESKELMDV